MLCSKLQPVSAAILNVLAVGAGGHPHRKYRAFARFARHGHVAAHHARELAREGKAQSSAAEVLRGRGIGLGELFEQLCLLLRSHADAGVGDSELDEGTAIAHLACRKLDLAFFGELAGIAQEIEQDLLEPHRVRSERAQVLLRFNEEAVSVLFGELSCGADDLVQKPGQIHRLGVEFELARFDLREVQYLVD